MNRWMEFGNGLLYGNASVLSPVYDDARYTGRAAIATEATRAAAMMVFICGEVWVERG